MSDEDCKITSVVFQYTMSVGTNGESVRKVGVDANGVAVGYVYSEVIVNVDDEVQFLCVVRPAKKPR